MCRGPRPVSRLKGSGLVNAALQTITPNRMRGQVSALYLFVFGFIGYALGPTPVAVLTDDVFGYADALRYSLAVTAASIVPTASFIVRYGGKPYGRAVTRARGWE